MSRRITKKLALVLACVMLTAVLSPPAYAVTGYSKDGAAVAASFASEYGWDTSAMNAAEWVGKDGETYSRLYSHEKEMYEDMCTYTDAFCVEAGLLKPSSSGLGGGASIAAVARAEVDEPDCMEVPDGSNNVKYNTWRYGRVVYGDAYMWCANFVAWCANECGYIESELFNMSENVRGVYEYQTQVNGFDSCMGRDIKQLGGTLYDAVPGDIFCFGFSHIGIVTDVTDTSIEITQGNTCNRVMAINYTSASLSNPLVSDGYIIHVEYPQDKYSIFSFLVKRMELPPASAAGIVANIEHESGFNPNALGDSGTSYGICQWHNSRWDRLRSFCDSNGYDWQAMDGQLYYLQWELETCYPDLLSRLQSYTDDENGAYDAAYDWCISFERPDKMYERADARGNTARNVYYPELCGSSGN